MEVAVTSGTRGSRDAKIDGTINLLASAFFSFVYFRVDPNNSPLQRWALSIIINRCAKGTITKQKFARTLA